MITSGKRIIKRINHSYVIWFEESNRWVKFEEPAYLIYQLFSRHHTLPEIIMKCREKYHLPEHDARKFVSDIIEGIKDHSNTGSVVSPDIKQLNEFPDSMIKPYAKHTFLINGTRIGLYFQTTLLGYYIYPLFAHLEIKNVEEPEFMYEIFSEKSNFFLRNKKCAKDYWVFDEMNKLKKRLYIEITKAIYQKREDEWMSFVHASAVNDMNQTILFVSGTGAGKSTLAALLTKYGFDMVSDDFLPLEAENMLAYPFPAAISVKEGAHKFFAADDIKDLSYHGLKNRSLKYIYPVIHDHSWYKAYPVHKIVFVRFHKQSAFLWRKKPVLEALEQFYPEARLSGMYTNAKRFIEWFAGLECYQLEFSENEKAIEKITGLFGNK